MTIRRLKSFENAGIRVGSKRSEEQDRDVLIRTKQLKNAKATTKKAQQDIQRQLIKIQKKCHHKFNKTTGRCEFCEKHRSTHL